MAVVLAGRGVEAREPQYAIMAQVLAAGAGLRRSRGGGVVAAIRSDEAADAIVVEV